MPKTPRHVVNLVQDQDLRPKSDADYLVLKNLRFPVNKIDENFLPLFQRIAKSHGVEVLIHQFSDLEKDLEAKVLAKWPHGFQVSKTEVAILAPRKLRESKIDTLVQALSTWYAKHNYVLDASYRRTSKHTKVSLTKRAIA